MPPAGTTFRTFRVSESPKPAKDCVKMSFEAQNLPRFAPKTDFESKTTLGLGQKQDLSPRRPSFWAKNRI